MAKKNAKRGFTLVELIVVLVILAILAALLIPALTGYIDKARKSQVVAETRMLTQAVQTEMSTVYALNEEFQRQKTIGKPLTIASKKRNLSNCSWWHNNWRLGQFKRALRRDSSSFGSACARKRAYSLK